MNLLNFHASFLCQFIVIVALLWNLWKETEPHTRYYQNRKGKRKLPPRQDVTRLNEKKKKFGFSWYCLVLSCLV